MRRRLRFVLAAGLAGGATLAGGQEIQIPLDLQVSLLGRILTFDRSLDAVAGAELDLGIVYQKRFRVSVDAHEEIQAALAAIPDGQLAGKPLRVVEIEAGGEPALRAALDGERLDVLVVAPLRGLSIEDVVVLARRYRLRTYSTVPEYVEQGLALGVELHGNRPRILVNLTQAQAEGADLDSRLLQLARIVAPPK